MRRNENNIIAYFHCGLCVEELERDFGKSLSPREYSQLEAGWTKLGLQIWCKRHDMNIIHIDFQGQKHPADTTRPKDSIH